MVLVFSEFIPQKTILANAVFSAGNLARYPARHPAGHSAGHLARYLAGYPPGHPAGYWPDIKPSTLYSTVSYANRIFLNDRLP